MAKTDTYNLKQKHWLLLHQCNWDAILMARFWSPEKTAQPRPYFESFACLIASLSELNFMIGRIGPNTSSCIIFILWLTFTRTVWAKNWSTASSPRLPKLPLTAISAPLSSASLTRFWSLSECSIIQIAPTLYLPDNGGPLGKFYIFAHNKWIFATKLESYRY